MEYSTSVPFDGDKDAALEAARTILVSNGFKVESQKPGEMTVTSPGMMSTKQNPLLGVTFARIIVGASTIDVEADLGGVKRMRDFLIIFPPGLALTLMAVFLLCKLPSSSIWTCVLVALPWLFLSPMITMFIKRRSIDAVNTLVHNMMSCAKTG